MKECFFLLAATIILETIACKYLWESMNKQLKSLEFKVTHDCLHEHRYESRKATHRHLKSKLEINIEYILK